MAEAMALGKPVVATAYSGNLDFCNLETSCLVTCREIPVLAEQYWYSKGQVWADPDLDQAAAHMCRLFGDPAYRRRVAEAGQRLILEQYSPRAAGARYVTHLGAASKLSRA
jgi:glycosyltransferase involved in cell wall biosynthesis